MEPQSHKQKMNLEGWVVFSLVSLVILDVVGGVTFSIIIVLYLLNPYLQDFFGPTLASILGIGPLMGVSLINSFFHKQAKKRGLEKPYYISFYLPLVITIIIFVVVFENSELTQLLIEDFILPLIS